MKKDNKYNILKKKDPVNNLVNVKNTKIKAKVRYEANGLKHSRAGNSTENSSATPKQKNSCCYFFSLFCIWSITVWFIKPLSSHWRI